MRYSIILDFKNLSVNWDKYVFHEEKWNFEPIANSAHLVKNLALGKALNIYIDYLMCYPAIQHVK